MTKRMKQIISLFILMFFLSGCNVIDNIKELPDSLSPEEVAEIYNQEQLFLSIADSINNLEQVQTEIKTIFQYDDKIITKTQENFEQYNEQTLSNYEIQSRTDTDNQSLHESFILKDDKYYHQVQNAPYSKTEQPTRQPFIYLNFLQFILNENITWETVSEEGRVIEAQADITDANIIKELIPFLDLPVIVSPEAQYTFTVNYTFDPDTGAIKQAQIDGSIEDLENHFTISHELVSAKYNNDAKPIGLDTDTIPMTNSDDFINAFATANPTEAITNYEMQVIRGNAEKVIEEMFITQNTLMTEPYIELISSINDEGEETSGVSFQSTYYEQQAEEMNPQSWTTFNPYQHFTQRVIDQFNNLEKIDSQESADSYREIFDDLNTLTEAIGETNIDHFKENDQQIYGIDYQIDSQTHRLINVIIWNGDMTQTDVNTTTAYSFGRLNPYTLNLLSNQLNPQILEAIKE